jgi:hypothetical protein
VVTAGYQIAANVSNDQFNRGYYFMKDAFVMCLPVEVYQKAVSARQQFRISTSPDHRVRIPSLKQGNAGAGKLFFAIFNP